MSVDMPEDEINEPNIDKALNYLRLNHPEVATPEVAIQVLETMQVQAHQSVAHGRQPNFEDAVKLVLQSYQKD